MSAVAHISAPEPQNVHLPIVNILRSRLYVNRTRAPVEDARQLLVFGGDRSWRRSPR